jgi:glucosamine 6-phosphate synthetase-like amidotransferase/phosphosugar isomerase protein
MNDSRLEEMKLALEEIRARHAYTIVITDCYEELDKSRIDFVFEVPHLDYLSGILAIIPI